MPSGRLYRHIELRSWESLEDLAEAIIGAFDFGFDHAFGCYGKLRGNDYDSEERYELFADLGEADQGVRGVRRSKVGAAFPAVGKEMLLLFDDGDEWLFKVKLIGLGRSEPKATYPRVLKRVGAAPPRYPDLDEDKDLENEEE